jgi:hypothetical protein
VASDRSDRCATASDRFDQCAAVLVRPSCSDGLHGIQVAAQVHARHLKGVHIQIHNREVKSFSDCE